MKAVLYLIAAMIMLQVGHGQALELKEKCESLSASERKALSSLHGSDLSVRFYSVQGRSQESLQAWMNEHGPIDLYGHGREAYTHWTLKWRWPDSENTATSLRNSSSEATITLTLPCWNDRADGSAQLNEAWQYYFIAMLAHEAGHIQYVRDMAPSVAQQIKKNALTNPDFTPGEANRIGSAALKKIREHDLAYDQETRHGATQGARLKVSAP